MGQTLLEVHFGTRREAAAFLSRDKRKCVIQKQGLAVQERAGSGLLSLFSCLLGLILQTSNNMMVVASWPLLAGTFLRHSWPFSALVEDRGK
jgi:hypothetical protein